jgi:hypothetical protein
MGRSEIRITIGCPLSHVFATYTQPDTFRWANMRSVRWTQGNPWEVDSRVRIEPEDAYGVIVDQVLLHYEPDRRVDFISHFGGITMQSQVRFRALSDNLTEIESQLEFIGTFSRIASFAVGSAIEYGAKRFYQDLKQECERTAPSNLTSQSPQ